MSLLLLTHHILIKQWFHCHHKWPEYNNRYAWYCVCQGCRICSNCKQKILYLFGSRCILIRPTMSFVSDNICVYFNKVKGSLLFQLIMGYIMGRMIIKPLLLSLLIRAKWPLACYTRLGPCIRIWVSVFKLRQIFRE